ncbi:MAG TPA: hypothetical protein VHA12_00030 [Candidatus Nanoarchaeia archaeon]|nr:hypothetical protein [Candidatus Nanoarchaeia archaeon]
MPEIKTRLQTIRNWVIFIGILIILTIIPITRIAVIEILRIVGQLFVWILLLFVVIILLRWLIVRVK